MAKKNRFNRIQQTEIENLEQPEDNAELESDYSEGLEEREAKVSLETNDEESFIELVQHSPEDSVTDSDNDSGIDNPVDVEPDLTDTEFSDEDSSGLIDGEDFESDVDFDIEFEEITTSEDATEVGELNEGVEVEVLDEIEATASELTSFDENPENSTKNYRLFRKSKFKDLGTSTAGAELVEETEATPVRNPSEIKADLEILLIAQMEIESRQRISSTNLADAERASQEFAKFVSAVENSIAWRLKSRFENNLASADSDLDRVLQVSAEIDLSEVGYLVKIRRLFLRRFWKSTLFATLAIVLFVALQRILQDSTFELARYVVDYPLERLITTVLILWAGSIFTFIVWYYKTWSNYERDLRLSEIKLLWVRDNLKQVQEAKSKLTKLYAHAEQWISLISLSLHHPWQTDPKWEQASGSILSDEKLPNAVTVAQAVEGSAGAMAALERTAVARLLRPGWREQIFMRQIAAVAKHQGIQQDKYNIETFDKDSPSIPNGSRNFFVDHFRDSLVQLAVARSYLSELSIEVQTVGLLESKPPVKNDYVDDLSAIAEDLDLLGEVEVDQAWDGFLLDIVGSERDPIIPISPFSFTDRAVIENAHGLPKVHIQMPMRLRSLTENLESDRVLISAYEDSARLPLDLVVRVDSVGPLEPEMLKLWSKEGATTSPAGPNPSRGEVTSPSNCGNCGRRDCPAAAPGSTVACTYSGV